MCLFLTQEQIGRTSSLVMTLTGILKSILLVVTGILVWGTHMGILQQFGYTVAIVGLFFYSVPWETIREYSTTPRGRSALAF